VRVFITGERTGGGWHDFERWPPADRAPRQLWIETEDRLAWELPPAGTGGSRRYRYDLADPTPSRGGPVMITSKPVRGSGPHFAAGNRIRLQISSGAHPRYVRNPGTGEDPLTAEKPQAVDVELLYGPEQPSSLLLPATAPGRPHQAGQLP